MKQSSPKTCSGRRGRMVRPHGAAIPRCRPRLASQVPLLSVVIRLPDGKRLITTAAFETSARPVSGRLPVPDRSVIGLIGKSGRRTLWKPGAQYACGAMWHLDARGNLYGYDFRHPGLVYICRLNGEHVATLHLSLLRKNILKPAFFRTSSRGIRYSAANGQRIFLAWQAIEQTLRRRRGTGYARKAMRWLTGG